MATQEEKGTRFAELHKGEPFLIPNPWDAGSAKAMQSLGFEALATTSSGFAFTLGKMDSEVTLDEKIAHTAQLAEATDIPISVDLENGYGRAPEQAALAITSVAEVGAAGGSIEDWDRDDGELYGIDEAAERVAAAVEAARGLDFTFTLTARAENHLRGNPDIEDTIARLQAYEKAGADVLYAPWLRTGEDVKAVCDEVSAPVNVLARPEMSMSEIVEAGGQRVSVGGWLTWVAVEAMVSAAEEVRDTGSFASLAPKVNVQELLAGPQQG
jgi:2-methylisocitrate lyase-like PEP mutase family enzyme